MAEKKTTTVQADPFWSGTSGNQVMVQNSAGTEWAPAPKDSGDVLIKITKSESKPVVAGLNGKMYQIPVGVAVSVPKDILGVLGDANIEYEENPK